MTPLHEDILKKRVGFTGLICPQYQAIIREGRKWLSILRKKLRLQPQLTTSSKS
jgi:hypothetical protein